VRAVLPVQAGSRAGIDRHDCEIEINISEEFKAAPWCGFLVRRAKLTPKRCNATVDFLPEQTFRFLTTVLR